MKVLIACEFSGIVRDEFLKRGHDAISCDLEPSERPGPHYQGDVRDLIYSGEYDAMVAFPPCTHLACSGARWFKDKIEVQKQAVSFFLELANAPIPKIAIENPVGIMSTIYRKPDQIIQPWQFGHGETKATCLWLKNLPRLQPTNIVEGREHIIHNMAPSKDRPKERSRTYPGIAEAFAEQFGNFRGIEYYAR